MYYAATIFFFDHRPARIPFASAQSFSTSWSSRSFVAPNSDPFVSRRHLLVAPNERGRMTQQSKRS